MSDHAIVVENLSKRYLIGKRFTSSGGEYKYLALRDVIARELSNFMRKAGDVVSGRQIVHGDAVEEFWALREVSFEVKQGEVFGIIGRNGAGKSTLLKIFSRITEPTEGRVLLRGRVSSLLEVGTGFHPELTGRENIFLNGAILGMTQGEIRRKFDEIVEFAEVERFIDTPVKHYSSGMYVRLAFAVAAHLEPEILIVDEVLAVGDAQFQQKCLRKMNEVSRDQQRTVLFVSHNMEAVLKLCTRAMSVDSGRISEIGDVKAVVSSFLHSQRSSPREIDLLSRQRPDYFKGRARLAKVSPSDSNTEWSLPFGQQLSLDISIDVEPSVSQVNVLIALYSTRGFEVATWSNMCNKVQLPVGPGINTFRIGFPHMRLLPGQYVVGIGLDVSGVGHVSGQDFGDWIPKAVFFEIIPSPEAAEINADFFCGAIVPSATVFILDDKGACTRNSIE